MLLSLTHLHFLDSAILCVILYISRHVHTLYMCIKPPQCYTSVIAVTMWFVMWLPCAPYMVTIKSTCIIPGNILYTVVYVAIMAVV